MIINDFNWADAKKCGLYPQQKETHLACLGLFTGELAEYVACCFHLDILTMYIGFNWTDTECCVWSYVHNKVTTHVVCL